MCPDVIVPLHNGAVLALAWPPVRVCEHSRSVGVGRRRSVEGEV